MNAQSGKAPPAEAWQTLPGASRAVLVSLIVDGPSPRVELAAKLGLSKSSLTRSTRALVERDLVREGATELRSALGRPSEMLDVAPDSLNFAGVKLTGDRLYAVVTDLQANVVFSTEARLVSSSPESVVKQVGRSVASFRERYPRLVAAGVTLAGSIVPDSAGRPFLEESEFLGWRDLLLADLLFEQLGIPVFIENDVHALTAAEHWFGAGAGLDSMVLVTIGAGIGCGLVANGQLVNGANGLSGRLNHLAISESGPRCGLGHVGCASAYLTNSAIASAAGGVDEPSITYDSALDRARAGDRAALAAFTAAGFALGVLIGVTTNLFDPQRLVVSGDGIAVWELGLPGIADGVRAARARPLDSLDVRVRQFDFGEWARSAAILALRSTLAT